MFDWYPAKIPGLLGMNFYHLCMITFKVVMVLWMMLHQNAALMLGAVAFSGTALLDVGVNCALVTPLYNETIYAPPAGSHTHRLLRSIDGLLVPSLPHSSVLPPRQRSLHELPGPSWNASHPYELTKEDHFMLTLHVGFYICWLVGSALGALYLPYAASAINGYSSGSAFGGRPWRRWLCSFFYSLAVFTLGAAAFKLVWIFSHDSQEASNAVVDSVFIQTFLNSYFAMSFAPLWHIFMIFTIPLLIRRGGGIQLRLSLVCPSEEGPLAAIRLSSSFFLTTAWRILALVFLVTFMHENPASAEEARNHFVMGRKLREQPYCYIFTYIYTFMVWLLTVSVGIACARERLQRKTSDWRLILFFTASALLWGGMLIFQLAGMIELPPRVMVVNSGMLLVLLSIWTFLQYLPSKMIMRSWRRWWQALLFSVVTIALIVPAMTNIPSCVVLIFAWCLYECFVPRNYIWVAVTKIKLPNDDGPSPWYCDCTPASQTIYRPGGRRACSCGLPKIKLPDAQLPNEELDMAQTPL